MIKEGTRWEGEENGRGQEEEGKRKRDEARLRERRGKDGS